MNGADAVMFLRNKRFLTYDARPSERECPCGFDPVESHRGMGEADVMTTGEVIQASEVERPDR